MKIILNYKSILVKFILSLTIATVSIINSIPVSADSQIINTHTNYKGDIVKEYNDGTTTVINTNANVFDLYISELGDYNITCSSQQELNNLILEYKSHINDPKDLVNTIKKVEVTNTYIKYDSSIVTIYNNNSWSLINYNINTFIFTPAELTDYEINCQSEIELKNLIKTYKDCKEFGYF